MAGEHTIYLTSSANRNLFKKNTPACFTNRLASSIILDPKIEYEVGLISILYPDQYYAVSADNDDYNINVYTFKTGDVREKCVVKMKFDMLAGNIKKIVKNVNNNLIQYLKTYYYEFFPHIFKDETIIRWNDDKERTEILFNRGDIKERGLGDITKINIRIKKALADILGFRNDTLYTIFSKLEDFGNTISPIPPSPKCGVDYIYLYTDIIHPTNFGGQLVNILDCFSLENGGNKGIHNCIYKSINTNFIDEISIIITDQNGRAIRFREGSTLTCVLHIRPK